MTVEEKMRFTIKLAEQALECGEFPISAAIFHGEEVISSAYATEKADGRFLVHAELKALIEADLKRPSFKARRKMQLFTSLEPCMMCLGAAMSFFIGEVHYALESPVDGAVSMATGRWSQVQPEFASYSLPKIQGGLLRAESQELFRRYLALSPNSPMRRFAEALANL